MLQSQTPAADAAARTSAKPVVAVLMAVHANADATHFEEALASLRDQTYDHLRLFIYCDGPLKTEQERLLRDYLDTESGRDVVIRGAVSAGLPTGLNHLIDTALADPQVALLARMDADDISLPQRIEQQVAYLAAHHDVSIVGTWCIEFAEPGVPSFFKKLPCQADVADFMLYRSALAHPTVMFRRAVFDAGHRYDPALLLMQDYEFWARLLCAGYTISNVPEYLLWYRMAGDFFNRRTGLRRAVVEVGLRFRYARRAGLLRVRHLFGLAALFCLRIAPVRIKRLAYMRLR